VSAWTRHRATAAPRTTSGACSRPGGIASPDDVEYDERQILFRWSEQKLVVVMDLDG
jgi:hypothetical protein